MRVQAGARRDHPRRPPRRRSSRAKVGCGGPARWTPHSRTIPVRIELANAEGLLRPGMFATAWIGPAWTEAGEQVVTVPAAALQRLEDGWVVFLPRGEGTLRDPARSGAGRDLAARWRSSRA